jgi:hypothetical protein
VHRNKGIASYSFYKPSLPQYEKTPDNLREEEIGWAIGQILRSNCYGPNLSFIVSIVPSENRA